MPTQMTFTSLQADCQAYIERGFSAAVDPLVYAQIPSLINLAERRLMKDLNILGYREVVTATMTTGVAVYDKPERWRSTNSINFGTGTSNNTRNPMFPRGYEYLITYWPDDTATGTPSMYCDYDYSHWKFAPTPDAAYPFEVSYQSLPQLLDDNNSTNWATAYAPEALLYATLYEAALFVKSTELMGVYKAMYDDASGKVNGQDVQRIMDKQSPRTNA